MRLIQIVDYRPEWADEYFTAARHMRDVVGEQAIRIDHIGSTAVEGLAAKDVIDVQISVSSLRNEKVTGPLKDIGFVAIEDAQDNLVGMPQGSEQLAKRFLVSPEGQRRLHVHVRQVGRLNQRYPLVFRDYLRSQASVRDAYQAIKTELAKHFEQDSNAYYAIKDPYMDTVYHAAQLWAESSDWKPDDDFC